MSTKPDPCKVKPKMENQTVGEVLETEIKRRFVKDFLDILILQLVQTQPTWGYNIIKKTEAKYGVKLRHGALYPMLNTLQARGLITSTKELKKGRVRKTYKITPEGKKFLQTYHNFLKEQTGNGTSTTRRVQNKRELE
jgi:PadR family transcriptional regulator PadR